MRLGILTSHPIQYQAPYFRALAAHVDLQVYFAHRPDKQQQGVGFGTAFEWDIDLLSGYDHRFLHNISRQPGSNTFGGCDTPEIAEIIARERFDAFIVSGWYLKSYWQAIRACRKNGVPVLVRGDSQLRTPRSLLKRCCKQVVHRLALKQFDAFLTVGQRNQEYLRHYGVAKEKIYFAPHFVDNAWFAARAEQVRTQSRAMRRRWGAGERSFVILFVGKLQRIKRPQDILRAVAQLKGERRSHNYVAVFVGSGEMETELQALAGSLGVNAHFDGFKNQTELPDYYSASEVLVLPSESETWGLVVNEAMASGLPAIVSDAVGCGPDLIETGRTGFTFRTGDVTALSRQINETSVAIARGLNFARSVREKISSYSVETAVTGTLKAAQSVTALTRPLEEVGVGR